MANYIMPAGAVKSFRCIVRDANGIILPSQPVEWSTDQGGVTPDGNDPSVELYTAPLAVVTATVRATLGALSDSKTIDVVAGDPASVEIVEA